MRLFITILLSMLPLLSVALGYGDDSISAHVKKLGSANFQERQAATKALQERPEAATALRELLRSPDLEVRRRAAEILDYQDRQPLRELDAAVKDGRVDRAIKLLADWPKGKHENEFGRAVSNLARTLTVLHETQGGERIGVTRFRWYDEGEPFVVSEQTITEATKAKQNPLLDKKLVFLRATRVDLDYPRSKKRGAQSDLHFVSVIVASDCVRSISFGYSMHAIFAGGDVELDGQAVGVTIISGGDVNLKECSLSGSLVIARGKVICGNNGYTNNRIIAGNSVGNKGDRRGSIITENEPNPLGYIRWTNAPKEKAVPKGK